MHDVEIKDDIYAYYTSSNTNCQQFSVSSNRFKVVHYAFLIHWRFTWMRNSTCHDSSKLVWNTKLHYSITSVLVTDLSIAILLVCFWLHRTERVLCSNKPWHIAYNGNRQYNTTGSKLWALLPLYTVYMTTNNGNLQCLNFKCSIYVNHQWHLSNLQCLNYKCSRSVQPNLHH